MPLDLFWEIVGKGEKTFWGEKTMLIKKGNGEPLKGRHKYLTAKRSIIEKGGAEDTQS